MIMMAHKVHGLLFMLLFVITVHGQFDADPWHPTYTLEEISNAQGDCMRRCIDLTDEQRKSAPKCLTELGAMGYWGCQLSLDENPKKEPRCDNRLRVIFVSSTDCRCLRTTAGDCVNAYEIMYDIWNNIPERYKIEHRVRLGEVA